MPAAILGLLFYRYFQNDKVTFLRLNKGDFDKHKIGGGCNMEEKAFHTNCKELLFDELQHIFLSLKMLFQIMNQQKVRKIQSGC